MLRDNRLAQGFDDDLLRATREKTNLKQDRFDHRLYGELLKASEEMSSLADQGNTTWPALMQDLWASFYKAAPDVLPATQVDPAHRVNRAFLERILEADATEETRATTMLDELSSGLAALAAGQELLKEISQRPELQEAMDAADQATRASAEESPDGDTQAETLAAGAEESLQQAARSLRQAVRKSVSKGKEETQNLKTALSGWGMETGDLQQLPMDERLKVACQLLTPKLVRVADLVGRLRAIARARQKEKLKRDRDELHGITFGNDLTKLLPIEFAALRHPLRKLDFYRRYTEKQLMQYELREKTPQGRGPIIALIDASGSMAGEPMNWAIGIALALVDTARRQKRRAIIVFFASKVKNEHEFVGKPDIKEFMKVASVGANGGTDYEPALARGLEFITDVNYKKADIVMVTDGVCELAEDFKKTFLTEKARLGFRCWTILIGDESNADSLREWSDRVWPIRDLCDETAGKMFGEVY